MFKRIVMLFILSGLFSGGAYASLAGEWEGQEFVTETVKVRNIALPMFMSGSNTVSFNYNNNTVTISNGLGTFHGAFTHAVKVKYGLVFNHSFKVSLDKSELASVFLNGLSAEFGSEYIISDVKITAATVTGREFNEFAGEDFFEQEHALHGSYKIIAKFKIAQAVDPAYKLGASITLEADFGEFRPVQNDVMMQQGFVQTSASLFEKTAERMKFLFEKQAAR